MTVRAYGDTVVYNEIDPKVEVVAKLVGVVNPDGSPVGGVGGDPVSDENPLPVFSSSGITATTTFTPAAAAYGAGDTMDVIRQMAWTYSNTGLAVPSGVLIRILSSEVKIDVTTVPAGQTSYSLAVYTAAPPSALADNTLWTLPSGDLSLYKGKLALGTPADLGDALYVKTGGINEDIKLGTTSLFAHLITDGAHTAAAVARTVLLHGIVL